MTGELFYIVSGTVFGLSGGLTPGPLLTLVLAQSLRHGASEGIKVAVAPLLTDLPIVVTALFLVSKFSDVDIIIGLISLVGAIFLVYLGYHTITFRGTSVDFDKVKPQSFKKGILANVLNPNPYIFWMGIGAPTVIKASETGYLGAIGFIVALYFWLVGSKIAVAVLVSRSRNLLNNKVYILVVRFLGIILFIYAAVFISDAFRLLSLS
jgi:threonine/homoserine/homoserine lactone efflux protein